MKSQNQILFVKLFDSGGSNSHFKLLVKYFGAQNIILVLEDKTQVNYLQDITDETFKKITFMPWLPSHVQTNFKLTTNIKNLTLLIFSLVRVFLLSFRYGLAGITISSVEPERFLYLLNLPFLRVKYILHSLPGPALSKHTIKVCNTRLTNKKRIITVSKSMREAILQNWKVSASKSKYVSVIYNCVLEPIQTDDTPPPKQTTHITITTLGHVEIRKNPALWFETAKQITTANTDIKFEWLGNGPLLQHFQNCSADYPNIKFYGYSNNTQSFLKNADIYYQPSIIEPQGIAVLEAMYNKLPCVVTNIGGLPESVIDGYNGFVVNATEVVQHVAAITKLIADKGLRLELGNNSFERYTGHFTYDNFESEMNAIYR